MRPEVSEIVRLIYPELRDASTVENRESIRGVDGKSVFFLTHTFPEKTPPGLQSKQNLQ